MTLVVTRSEDLDPKGPGETKEYSLLWADVLGSDTIATGSATVEAGLTKVSEDHVGQTSTIMLSGGTANNNYDIAVTITTSAGRILERTFFVTVAEQRV